MQDRTLDLNQYEDNLLESCWRVGRACRSRRALISSFSKTEIAAVDTVACCKQITSLVQKKTSEMQRSHSVASKHQLYHHFKDFAQLTCGVTNIYCSQVDMLLEDTKHLLDQIKGNSFDLVLTTKKSVLQTSRKRKAVITKKSKLMISKRLRLDESDLLSEPMQHYYANMLSECQVWQSECTQQVNLEKSIELPRNSTQVSSYHEITITEEFQIHEEPSNIYPSEGFGSSDEADLTYFHELYPRYSAKRRLTNRLSTDILPAKMPRLDAELDTSQEDSAILTTNYPAADSPDTDVADITYIVCEPSLPLEFFEPPSRRMSFDDSAIETTHSVKITQPVTVDKNKSTNSRRKKLIIDKCIKYSRKKPREKPFLKEKVVAIPTSFERRKTAEDLLTKLNKKISVFPDVIKISPVTLTDDEQSENTLRSIFGVDFTEDLVKEVFAPLKSRKIKEKNIVFQPVVPEEQEDINLTPPLLLPVVESNNNSSTLKYTIGYKDNNFDAYSVMMDLLMIWRNNPEIQGIDANKFILSFPDRIKASLAFNFLLYLTRDKFIKISTKPNSIEMDRIELGAESNRLIIEGSTQDLLQQF
ncbi:hypothetical protein KR059_002616 [Drosophila kikkawai]|nr:hypothetical protein KR059_002616 [Drosophila kikkawai]